MQSVGSICIVPCEYLICLQRPKRYQKKVMFIMTCRFISKSSQSLYFARAYTLGPERHIFSAQRDVRHFFYVFEKWRRKGTWISVFATREDAKANESAVNQAASSPPSTASSASRPKPRRPDHGKSQSATALAMQAAHEAYMGFESFLTLVEPQIRDYRA